jgi:hypothetical protein
VDRSVAGEPVPIDRARELAAMARERAEQMRWCVCLNAAQFELAAAKCAAGEQTIESQVLVRMFRARAQFARRVIEGESNGGSR